MTAVFFESGYSHTLTQDLDPSGKLSVNVRLTSGPGQNNIHIYPFGSISHKWEWIIAEIKGIPFSINEVEITPSGSPPSQVVNQNFYVTYILYDRFGNIANNQTVSITSDGIGGPWLSTSNYEGKVYVTYSQPLAGTYRLTATTPANTTVTTNRTVYFYNAEAAGFIATANPALIPSRDVNPAITSDISVTVMDIMGNPVKGKNVTFSAPHNIVLDGTAASAPSIVDTLVVTDVNGDATTKFIPGAFVNATQPGYKSTATGSCLVTAIWNGQSKDVEIKWKNYPYLSAVVSLSKPVVFVNDTFDVRVRLNGDGWALHAKPIDVVLATDRSGSMAGTKMTDAKNAAKLFTGNLTDQDQEGLVSFSTWDDGIWDYTSTLDKVLTQTNTAGKTSLKTTITGYNADGNTAMRSAIWRSANLIKILPERTLLRR